jgi:RHS repeat-associated protein
VGWACVVRSRDHALRASRRLYSRLVFFCVVLAVLAVLPAAVACARTLSPEPSGGGFVENSDHTWTFYGDGHVVKVYSSAEKETFDRVWHAEEFDLIPFRASGYEVTGISSAEAEAAGNLLKSLQTGKPYATGGEEEVGIGYMRTVEEKGIIGKRAETLFGGLIDKTIYAGKVYGYAIAIGHGIERMFTLPAWGAGMLFGEKEHGESGGQPIKYRWLWQAQFKVIGSPAVCTGFPFAKGVKENELCAFVGQPVSLTNEQWEPVKEEWAPTNTYDEEGYYSSSEPFVAMNCVADLPYPTCSDSLEGEHDETIGEYVNVSQTESRTGELGFPAAGLGSNIPRGYEEVHGLNESEPSYKFGEHKEATSVSNPDVAPLADELYIAYGLQSSLLPGLEGGVIPNPVDPGAPPRESQQNESKCGKPVACATGNETLSQTDLQVGGRGVGLNLTRSYSSQAAAAGVKGLFGYGWTSSFSDHLILEPALHLVLLVTSSGATVPFSESGGSFTAPASSQDKLSGSMEAGYTLTLANQTQMKFQGSSGRLETVTDRNGNETKLSYNGTTNLLETISDPAGRKLTLKENTEGFVESVKDPMGHEAKYSYESETLATVTLPGESSANWTFKADGSHQITGMTDGRGGKTINKYNANHQVEEQTDPMNRTLKFAYATLQTTITDEGTGAVTLEQFAPNGEPASITRGYGTASATTESWEYNAAGYETIFTDGNEHITKYGYDSEANLTSVFDANKNETKWEYNAAHEVMATTTPKGETTTIKRDSHGNAEMVSRPAPGSTTQIKTYKYDSHGNVESMEDSLKRVWKYEYDSAGDRTSETDPEGDKRTWVYNEDSQKTSTVGPRGNVTGGEPSKYTTTIERGAQGRPLKITDPLGHATKYTYDADGNLETRTDPNSHTTTYTYDADNEQTKVKEPNGTLTETGYDGAGEVISQTDGNKHETKYVRNILERLTEEIDPLGRKTIKEYDKAGNLKKLTDAAARTTTYTYDPANRLIEVSYSDGKTHLVKYEYDADGDRTSMLDGTGITTYTYDQLDRLAESKDGHGDKTSYEYDLANQQTKITYPNGKAVTQAYDKAGRLEKITDWLEHTTKFAYDPDSNLTTITFPTGTNDVDKYTYNEADQMSEEKSTKGAETLASLVYARDNDGQVKTITSKGLPGEEKPGYEYDTNNRLAKAVSNTYEYDSADNPTKIPGSTNTYDNADELKTGTSLTYAYDELGERTKRTPTSGAATTYGYDQAGNLISLTRPKETKVAEIKDTYTYDGNDLRTSQTISGTTSYLTWNPTRSLPLILNDGTNSYIQGPGGLPVEQITSAGAVTYLHHDQQGSTRLLTGSTGTVTGSTTFDAYGNKTGSTGTSTTPLGYDGQYTSSDTGLIYLRARVYDPATAQFLSVDPIEAITRAPYGYARENPLTFGDPSGLSVLGNLESAGETLLHAGLDAAALPPYAVYYGSYKVAHGINSLGKEFGLPGEVASHLAALPLSELEALGLSEDALIDWIKGHTVNSESICDEGPGFVAHLNPLHQYLPIPGEPAIQSPPGIHSNGEVDFEW